RFLLRPTMGLAVWGGLAGGLALATRPSVAMLLAAAVPLVFVIALVRRWSVGPALAAALLFAIAAAGPIAPVLARHALPYPGLDVTSQTGDYLALCIVPLVTERADGTPYQATFDRMDALYRQQAGTETNPFRRSAIASGLAWQEMARLPPAALAKAWLEGMVVNLAAPALLADPRVRALPKPSFYNTPGAGLWQKGRAYPLHEPGRYHARPLLRPIPPPPFPLLHG